MTTFASAIDHQMSVSEQYRVVIVSGNLAAPTIEIIGNVRKYYVVYIIVVVREVKTVSSLSRNKI